MKALAAGIGVVLIWIGLMLTAVGFVELPHVGSFHGVWLISWIPIAFGIAAFFVKPRDEGVSRQQGFEVKGK